MEIVEEYYCWLAGEGEGNAKVIKSDSVKEAAKTAVDSWRHEGSLGVQTPTLLVKVRDPEGHIHQVNVRQDLYLDESGPQA